MLRGTTKSLREAVTSSSRYHQVVTPILFRPWVGCSHWTTPFRPLRTFSTTMRPRRLDRFDSQFVESKSLAEDQEQHDDAQDDVCDTGNTDDVGIETLLEGVTIDQLDPADSSNSQMQNDRVNLETPEENVCIFQHIIQQKFRAPKTQ
jgi:hypothetical protein